MQRGSNDSDEKDSQSEDEENEFESQTSENWQRESNTNIIKSENFDDISVDDDSKDFHQN